jgi:hypothetical protein
MNLYQRLLEIERRQTQIERYRAEMGASIQTADQDLFNMDSYEILLLVNGNDNCDAPVDPNWPVALFAFHGILEYGYLDSTIGTINSAVVDKDSLRTIQEFRVKQFTDSSGTLRQFRGASGWYFQAAASTAQARINASNQDERDPANRAGWGDIVTAWTGGVNVKPISNLFMGLPIFGGYYYGTRDPFINGNIDTAPGPIRVTYLYGDSYGYNNCQMQFALQSPCKARLTGTTQAIPDWAATGSLLSDTTASDISILPGTDNFIILDGLRAIRIRPMGWLAHMADHAMKSSDTFTNFAFPAGMQMVWRESATSFASDNGTPLGDYTEQYTTSNGTITYNNKIEISAFHHRKFGEWADSALGAPDRYNLKARAKVWYKVSGSQPARPDPYKAILGNSYAPPDEVVEVQAQERKTVHTPPTGAPFFDAADYAKNPGFIFTFAQTVNNIAYLHVTFHYNEQIIGTQFWGYDLPTSPPYQFPLVEQANNVIRFQKTTNTDSVTDDFSASLVVMPFGITVDSPLPKVFLAVKTITGTLFRAVTFQIYWPSPMPGGATYAINYGDGNTATGLTTLTPSHTYDTDDTGDTYETTLTATWSGGSFTHKTYITV